MIFIISIAVLLLLALGAAFLFKNRAPYPSHFTIDGTALTLEPVLTTAQKVLGLSGRDKLSENHGMLFVYSGPGKYGIWMRDMHFPIDIIWLDANYHVVDVMENATPDSFPKVFRPKEPAHYVLEVNAGFAERYRLSVGNSLKPIY